MHKARHGPVRWGWAGFDLVRCGMAGKAGYGQAWRDEVRRGRARHGYHCRSVLTGEREVYVSHRRYRKEQTHMPKKSDGGGVIELHRLPIERIQVRIIGLSPLIPHSWSEKSKRMMPGHPDGERARMEKKGPREPVKEANSCVYWLEDGRPAMPATAYKAAMVGACRLFARPTMVEAKQLFFVEGELRGTDQFVPFSYRGEPVLREDTPRNSDGGADLRYRYAFFPWWATLTIRYGANNISAESIVTLVDAAGSGGIGDWRPSAPRSSTGTFGVFRVMTEEEEADYA